MPQRSRILLVLIFLLAFSLRSFRIGLDGLSNLYYAASVRSMLSGWHNFFFAAFDPAGFVTVDKPPVGFWVQALSAHIFGFEGWALVLPQALAGALCCVVLYYLVCRTFGDTPGLVAALILAVTPVSVATHRSNTPDAQLLLVLLLAAWFALKAAETGQLRWILACAALVGLGFNIKMLQAYLVAPAFFLFLPPPLPLLKRIGQLGLATLVLLSVSLAWPALVDLTPTEERPYVGSTVTNHELELMAVHNGVRRLGPIAAWFGIRPKGDSTQATPNPAASSPAVIPAATVTSDRAWPDGGYAEVGSPGSLRLFNPQLAGQVSWLLPLALLELISGAARTSWKQPLGREALFYALCAGWLAAALFFFSYGGLIHRYYLDMLAPPVAALSALGLTAWARQMQEGERSGWLLPAAVALTSALAVFFLGYYPEAKWLILPTLLLSILVVLVMILLSRKLSSHASLGLSLLAVLFIPVIWASTPMWRGGDVILPYAGPDLVYWGGDRGVMREYTPLARYLEDEHGEETFIAATANAVLAAPLQLLTGQPVMALGGFTGSDPILTDEEMRDSIADHQVRFFLVYREEPASSEKYVWLLGHCELAQTGVLPKTEDLLLFDCAPR